MRKRRELEFIKTLIDSTYNNSRNRVLVNTDKKYDPEHSKLGYCFKYTDPVTGSVVYKIDCSKIGIDRTDFRIMMHEYGHIYKGHLDGIHEELDTLVCNVFRDHRAELIELVNRECGIDYADKLIERIIDDPQLNHSIHNIAMDMEVNSSVLSKEDIEEMEWDITSILPKREEELLKNAISKTDNEELKKALNREYEKLLNEAKIKFMLPCRYYTGLDDSGNPIPFPDGLTYADYLILIISHMDQFIKMMVSIKMGGNGDTSQISKSDVQNALNGMLSKMQQRMNHNQSEAYKQGYKQALQDERQKNSRGQQYQEGYKDGFNDHVGQEKGSDEFKSGFNDGQADSNENQDRSEDYKEGFNAGQEDNRLGNPEPTDMSDKSQEYQDGYKDGKAKDQQRKSGEEQGREQEDYQEGYKAGQRSGEQQQQQGNGNDEYSQGYQDGQEAAENAMSGGQPQPGQGGQGQGQSQQEQQDYQDGYNDALRDLQQCQGQGQGGMQSLSDLMSSLGITQPQPGQSGQGQGGQSGGGTPTHNKLDPGQKKGEGQAQKDTLNPYEGTGNKDFDMDHKTESRDEADQRRKEGKIQAGGGVGCGKGGAPEATREVDKVADDVDMALGEVIADVKHRVVKQRLTRDVMKNYNRGIIRSVIAPSIERKISISTNPKIVFLIDISGSMDTRLVDRILKTIAGSIKKINRDLRYDIITWSTHLGEHIKDIDPRKSVPRVSYGGGTEIASGMEYFRDNYGPEAILVIISDFCDSLDEWHRVELTMKNYSIWGFNYGDNRYSYRRGDWDWKYLKQRNFSNYGYD